jgi:hypothetical protein
MEQRHDKAACVLFVPPGSDAFPDMQVPVFPERQFWREFVECAEEAPKEIETP